MQVPAQKIVCFGRIYGFNVVEIMRVALLILAGWLLISRAQACVWDADTLMQEKFRSHDLASAILKPPPPEPEDVSALQARIQNLETNRDENNSNWWNNLAGAYIRLGHSQKAVDLLAPVIDRFPNDYGMHANLGTAYHLLGRYDEAEKEIARDLEINPEAHFGLEKYHLALLQYLVRDTEYKKQHLYVDEWSRDFTQFPGHFLRRAAGKLDFSNSNALDVDAIKHLGREMSYDPREDKTNSWEWSQIKKLENDGYVPPPYRFKWDLAADTNFEAGIIYMAQMNPQEPACFEMLGVAAMKKRDYNLATAAFEKAIELGSLKSDMLREKVSSLHEYIHNSLVLKFQIGGLLSIIPLLIVYYIYTKIRDRRRRLKTIT